MPVSRGTPELESPGRVCATCSGHAACTAQAASARSIGAPELEAVDLGLAQWGGRPEDGVASLDLGHAQLERRRHDEAVGERADGRVGQAAQPERGRERDARLTSPRRHQPRDRGAGGHVELRPAGRGRRWGAPSAAWSRRATRRASRRGVGRPPGAAEGMPLCRGWDDARSRRRSRTGPGSRSPRRGRWPRGAPGSRRPVLPRDPAEWTDAACRRSSFRSPVAAVIVTVPTTAGETRRAIRA